MGLKDAVNLDRNDILRGIEKYEELKSNGELNNNRHALNNFFRYEEKEYSPKYIVDLAYNIKYDTNKEQVLKGHKSRSLLKELGFEIIHKSNQKNSIDETINSSPLNQILYGPPGTGKTYNTINKALEIIDGEVPEDRKEARECFNKLRESGQIEFVTFHQSYGYEEFVEGIKADLESDEIRYVLEDGIFKRLVEKATTKNEANIDEKVEWLQEEASKNDIDIMENTKFVLKYRGGKTFRITPKNTKNPDTDYPVNIESIKKLYKNEIKRDELYNSSYAIGILEYLYKKGLKKYDDIKDTNNKNYILIIDEINRGNISKIFGELITLIEPSKRIGEDEEIRLTLPNSKESFGVPSNLYIIGTMNTADRSIAQIDTALRRRFEFVEMMPKIELLVDKEENPIIIGEIEIQKVLEAMNERIEYIYDREHTIGHSYFLPLIDTRTQDKLEEIFRVKVLPLLAEYFYGDWGDIAFVLNNNFVKKKDAPTYIKSSSRQLNDVYEINEVFELEEYKKIYNA